MWENWKEHLLVKLFWLTEQFYLNTVILDGGTKPYCVTFRETLCFEKNKGK